MTVPTTAAADVTTAMPRMATSSVTNTDRRDTGRARSTSRVPFWRSPAIAMAAKPTGKTTWRAIAIGCPTPSAIAASRPNTLEPRRRTNACGTMPDWMSDSIWRPKVA